MNAGQKSKVLKSLRASKHQVLDMQRECRVRLDALPECMGSECRYPELNWGNVQEIMDGHVCPADHSDRKKLIDQDWDQIPFKVRVNSIADPEIRNAANYLGMISDHLKLLQALVAFYEGFNLNKADEVAGRAFSLWRQHGVHLQLAKELRAKGDCSIAASLERKANIIESGFDMLIHTTAEQLLAMYARITN